MNYISKTTHESALFPGVSFRLRKLSFARRIKLDAQLATERSRLRGIGEEYGRIKDDESPGADLRRGDLNAEAALILDGKVKPAYIREALASIAGLEIDGTPASIETLLADGPPDLVAEIHEAIDLGIALGETERKNSEPPSTSGGQADGTTPVTIAESAPTTDGLSPETAGSFTPAT